MLISHSLKGQLLHIIDILGVREGNIKEGVRKKIVDYMTRRRCEKILAVSITWHIEYVCHTMMDAL